jgi:hypothetical protein
MRLIRELTSSFKHSTDAGERCACCSPRNALAHELRAFGSVMLPEQISQSLETTAQELHIAPAIPHQPHGDDHVAERKTSSSCLRRKARAQGAAPMPKSSPRAPPRLLRPPDARQAPRRAASGARARPSSTPLGVARHRSRRRGPRPPGSSSPCQWPPAHSAAITREAEAGTREQVPACQPRKLICAQPAIRVRRGETAAS